MSQARIFKAADSGFYLETPYNAAFVRELKGSLPKYARKWDPDRRLWWIAQEFGDSAIRIARQHYDRVIAPELALAEPTAWDVLWLRPGAPSEVVNAVYRALAKMHHPDYGGDNEMMQLINAAYERVLAT